MIAQGWMLHLRGGLQVAVGTRELIYVLPEDPEIHDIPLAPAPAPGVIIWENRLVPVIDAGLLLRGAAADYEDPTMALVLMRHVVVIVAFVGGGATDGGVELGALILRKVPERVEVSDDQGCELPGELAAHYEMFTACFEHPDVGSVPVLDLVALFSNFGRERGRRSAPVAHMSVS